MDSRFLRNPRRSPIDLASFLFSKDRSIVIFFPRIFADLCTGLLVSPIHPGEGHIDYFFFLAVGYSFTEKRYEPTSGADKLSPYGVFFFFFICFFLRRRSLRDHVFPSLYDVRTNAFVIWISRRILSSISSSCDAVKVLNPPAAPRGFSTFISSILIAYIINARSSIENLMGISAFYVY